MLRKTEKEENLLSSGYKSWLWGDIRTRQPVYSSASWERKGKREREGEPEREQESEREGREGWSWGSRSEREDSSVMLLDVSCSPRTSLPASPWPNQCCWTPVTTSPTLGGLTAAQAEEEFWRAGSAPGLSGAKVQQRAGLGWLKSTTGSRHECPHAEDRSSAQHDGHGDQLDVSDSAFSGGTQWDRHLQRGELRKDCQCAYDIFSFSC